MSHPIGNNAPNMDQAYIHQMQYMSLNGQGDSESPYGRIMGKAEPAVPTFHQKQRSMGAIESFAVEGNIPPPQKQTADYKMYERNNIIAASKYATPKQVETLSCQAGQENQNYNGSDYVQCAKPQVRNAGSPTHSLSGSSQHSGSPRTSVAMGPPSYDYSTKGQGASPLYENIDYYGARNAQAPYYHQVSPNVRLSNDYEPPSYRKAQPQVPAGSKHMQQTRDMDAPPVYENVHELSHKSGGATPGPQVAQGQAPPPYPNQHYSTYQPQPTPPVNQPVYSVMTAPRPQPSKASPQIPAYYYHGNPPKSPAKSLNLSQQQLDEINGSDYVCMTGNVSQTLSTTGMQFQMSSATSYSREPATGIAGAPTSPVKQRKEPPAEPPRDHSSVRQTAPSPTPSNCSTASITKIKIVGGKTLLPYSVTPPKPRGPTEAERKIEEMTRQIEEEMEKHEEEGEYFGELF